ncbi:MAG: peptidoglycan DD-metalloendopeptidase family protein [Clostridiales bacterium]|nr:peptidoglycan DD-metalloendopeptidase family protein [Clostridiales bacterium]MDY2909024.1 peptidoglycan DD-metalloendopeptidase family protein [Oscillospiraceae bacterium]
MFGKRLKSAISVLLSLVLMFSLVLCFTPTNANAATTQAEIDELKEQRNQLKEQQKDIQNTVNSLRGQQDKLIELKTALDEKNAITLQQILNLEEQITLHEELIEQKSVELEKAQDVADEQLSRLKVRIRNMEENGRYNYVAVLFGAESISEFLSLMDDIGDIMKSDRDLENSYKEAVTDLKTVKSEYEEARLELKEQKAELTNLSAQLEKDILEANAAILELEGDISANSAILSQLNAQDKEMQDKINQKIKELNEQNKPSNPSNPSNPSKPSGSGTLTVWPSYCTYITSVQGNRVHPITGQYGTHGGTDIGASYGSAIYAAGSGTVVTAYNNSAYNGGYGNYAMINHGNGIQTLYAHMSVCSVTVGQTVSAGQTIGYVGSTGRSTGPHLHFEVRVNGSRVDPQSYYPGISFSYSPTAWGG